MFAYFDCRLLQDDYAVSPSGIIFLQEADPLVVLPGPIIYHFPFGYLGGPSFPNLASFDPFYSWSCNPFHVRYVESYVNPAAGGLLTDRYYIDEAS